ncbi:hypothetical protein IVB41_08205 [Bradyrhizobium sp. 44]|uniref:hypothetical protein n=1 Tax=Bradyrhizobium sp. 44 TaxID=2782675 RepID=UPI001FFAB589|nr:hypothetical protein [Bradyrhizobium sp. 44]MCK1283919.1 hypothetical protein [Bradyrhizobium sp. 44]
MSVSLHDYLAAHRVRSFKDISGHGVWLENILANLEADIGAQSYQPFLLIGIPGVGKLTLAKLYAQALVCMEDINKRIDAAPCGVCDECMAIQQSSLACVEIDAHFEGNVNDEVDWEEAQADALHTLIEREGGLNTADVRVVIINNAEELTQANADIALKTLEREFGSSLYIFVVNDEGRLSAALRSRCRVYRVGPIPAKELLAIMARICNERLVTFEDGALHAIAMAANGSFGNAIAIIRRVESHGAVSTENLLRLTEFGWGATMLTCWAAVLSGHREQALSLFEDVGADCGTRVKAVQAFLVECRIRRGLGTSWTARTPVPALHLIPSVSWARVLNDWSTWCQQREVDFDELLEKLLEFWSALDPRVQSRAAFLRGYELVA